MELLTHPVVAMIILLGVLVFVHEFGHYIVGRMSGIAVEIFSIGFGPVLFSIDRKETNYRICAIPLGGYVKFYGSLRTEEVPKEVRGREFYSAPLFGRIMTVAAGPLANLILAIVVFAGRGWIGVDSPAAVAATIVPGSPAEAAGLKPFDKIVQINGNDIENWPDLSRIIEELPNSNLDLKVNRDGEIIDLQSKTDAIEVKELGQSRGRIGISYTAITSVITVADPQSAAAKAGLESGQRIVSVSFSDTTNEIKFWEQFKTQLEKAVAAGVNSIQLAVIPFDPSKPWSEQNKEENRSIIELPLAELSVSGDSGQSIAKALGLRSSELTIHKSEKGYDVLQADDELLAWNGSELNSYYDLQELASDYRKAEAQIQVRRGGELVDLDVILKPVEVQMPEGKVTLYRIPAEIWAVFEVAEIAKEQYTNPIAALNYGFWETVYASKTIAAGVVSLFTGNMPIKALGGPISIAKFASDSAKLGVSTFTLALAWLSINLGLINLVPIPALDGGQLVLLFAEGANRKPLPEVVIENYQKIGFVMILALVVLATYNDLGRFWTSMLSGMGSIF